MANLADLDPSFSVPCRQCSAMLQKGNRFCPFCFEDQFAERDAGLASPPGKGGRAAAAPGRRSGRVVIDFEDTGQPDEQEAAQFPGPAGGSLDEADAEIGFVRPGIFNATEVPPADGNALAAARSAAPRRLVIGIACALVLVALAAGLWRAYSDIPLEAGKPQTIEPQAEGVHATLKPAEVPPPEPPPVPAADVAPAPAAPAPPAVLADAPVAADPAPPAGKAVVAVKGCSEALAALALCPGK